MRIALLQELEGRILQIDELGGVGRFGSEMLKYNAIGEFWVQSCITWIRRCGACTG